MANTKVTSRVLADDAVNISNINTVDGNGGASSPSADGQALVAKADTVGYYLDWESVGVAGISSSADATAITIGSDESVDFAKGIVVEGSGTLAGVYLNGTNSDTATQGNFVRYGTNFATQSNAANSNLITKTFNGSTFVDAHVISSAGRTGLHTTSPDAELHIEPVSSNASIVLSNDGRTQYYRIQNNESADALTFNLSDASEKLRIQSGGGISFNGDTAAANALDDYEEGTWIPVLTGSSTGGSFTVSSQAGIYTKIGGMVNVQWLIVVTGVTTQPTGNVNVTGLPFAYSRSGGTAYMPMGVIGYNDIFSVEINKAYVTGSQLNLVPNGITQSNSNWSSVTLSTGYFSGSVWYAA